MYIQSFSLQLLPLVISRAETQHDDSCDMKSLVSALHMEPLLCAGRCDWILSIEKYVVNEKLRL